MNFPVMIFPAMIFRSLPPLAMALVTTVFATSLPFAAQAQTAPDSIACSGPFAKDATHAKIVAAFGAKNVTLKTEDAPDGTTNTTLIFGKDEKKRITVYWLDEEKKARPQGIMVQAPSAWTGPLGIRAGMTIEEVEALNGAPFSIYGFEWDMGGYVVDLKGKLTTIPGGCNLMLRFNPGVKLTPQKTFDAITGEKKIPSTNALLRSAKPTLAEWTIDYAKPATK
jgi:hypothetical protein